MKPAVIQVDDARNRKFCKILIRLIALVLGYRRSKKWKTPETMEYNLVYSASLEGQ